ncbi:MULTISPECIES: hypothetical protein [unclassified Bradyrhizobium]|uniref:hypothetical protein n=1 Tax=unclassified Bradyrhizobium TaxID=2631580 RepID=UPI002479226E|nr:MULTISPECIES: hypothetical protein [unclassified Bradyrhizobium]WGS21628.1 hypothetical protein MTX22_07950 [Bradyrhizobium sp. ISRA463]WGS28573.1 hypothetical protein MTX19_05785 [Bradyrhizobium sp. ISRA464]
MITPAAIVLAGRRSPAYLKYMVQPIFAQPRDIAAPTQGRVASMILWGAASVGGLALLAAAVLWFHYGTAVFFEMITAGISACF